MNAVHGRMEASYLDYASARHNMGWHSLWRACSPALASVEIGDSGCSICAKIWSAKTLLETLVAAKGGRICCSDAASGASEDMAKMPSAIQGLSMRKGLETYDDAGRLCEFTSLGLW